MAGLDDISKKASDFWKSGKAQDALKSEKAEGISDKVLDGVAGFADKITGGKHSDKIESARDAADKRIGTDGAAHADDKHTGAAPAERPHTDAEAHADGPRTAGTPLANEQASRLRGKLIDPKS